MSTSLVTFALLPVRTAAVVGISHSMVLSVALLVELMAFTIWQQQLAKTFTVTVKSKDTADNIHKGRVRVGFWVGNCNNGHALADAYTGWPTMSRIFIEEVARAQQ